MQIKVIDMVGYFQNNIRAMNDEVFVSLLSFCKKLFYLRFLCMKIPYGTFKFIFWHTKCFKVFKIWS